MAPDGRDPRRIPGWIERGGGIAWRLLAIAALLYVVANFVERLTVITVPLAVAALLAGVLEPIVGRAARPAMPDWLAPLVAVLLVLVVVVAVVLAIGVRIADQLPELRSEFASSLREIEDGFSVELPSLPGGDGTSSVGGVSASDVTRVVSVGAEVLFGFFLTLALTFLFLKDGPSMWSWVLSKVAPEARDEVDTAGRAAWETLGSYVRGLTVVALFDAIGIGIGLVVLGVPLALTLAALQFVGSYIPTVGAFVAGGVAVMVAFGAKGFVTAAITLVIVVVVQQIGNDVIEPWIMGRVVSLHPAVVLVAVSAGAILWGIPGALLFVPLAAAGSAAGHVVWERRHEQG